MLHDWTTGIEEPTGATVPPVEVPPPPKRMRTDLGNAERLVDRYGDRIRWCPDWGTWLVWDGRRWVRDRTGQVQRYAAATVRSIYGEAEFEADPEKRQEIVRHARSSEGKSRLDAMEILARRLDGIAVVAEDLDRDPMVLNVENGTLDLAAGRLRPHNPADLLTKCAGTRYDATAACPRWDAFLRQIFADDDDLIAFVQRAAGYCLTARTSEQVLLFGHGGGANGKSTLLNVLLSLLGDYGTSAADGLLLAKANDTHPTELADLQGKRLVVCQETEDGRRFAEVRLKQLTGEDRVKARYMRQDFFEFEPTHKLFMAANHKPAVRGTDHAIWRRMRLIPFLVTFTPDQRDKALPLKLQEELPGILRWSLEGCMAWQVDGLGEPQAVKQATDAYRAEMDVLGAFIAERTEAIDETAPPGSCVTATELYAAYRQWADATGERAVKQRKLGQLLGERGYVAQKRTTNPHKGRTEYPTLRLVG